MNIEASSDLIVRALVTRIEYLESKVASCQADDDRLFLDAAILEVEHFLFLGQYVETDLSPGARAARIIEELQRKGITAK